MNILIADEESRKAFEMLGKYDELGKPLAFRESSSMGEASILLCKDFSFLERLNPASNSSMILLTPKITDDIKQFASAKLQTGRLVVAGLRYPNTDSEFYRETRTKHFPMRQMLEHGMQPSLESIMEIANEAGEVLLAVDMDVIDPAFTGNESAPGGFTSREAIAIVQKLRMMKKLRHRIIICDVPDKRLCAKIIEEIA